MTLRVFSHTDYCVFESKIAKAVKNPCRGALPHTINTRISSYTREGEENFEKLQEPAQHPLRVRDKPLRDGFAIAAGRRDRRCLSRPPAAMERLGVCRA